MTTDYTLANKRDRETYCRASRSVCFGTIPPLALSHHFNSLLINSSSGVRQSRSNCEYKNRTSRLSAGFAARFDSVANFLKILLSCALSRIYGVFGFGGNFILLSIFMTALEPIYGELVESTLSKIREKRKIAARGVYPAPSFALVRDIRTPH